MVFAVTVLVLIIGGWYISTTYNHGAHKSESERTAPTESGRTKADGSMDAHTKGNIRIIIVFIQQHAYII